MEQEQLELRKVKDELKILRADFEKLKEDLEFSKRVDEAWERYDKGEFIEMDKEKFLRELKKW